MGKYIKTGEFTQPKKVSTETAESAVRAIVHRMFARVLWRNRDFDIAESVAPVKVARVEQVYVPTIERTIIIEPTIINVIEVVVVEEEKSAEAIAVARITDEIFLSVVCRAIGKLERNRRKRAALKDRKRLLRVVRETKPAFELLDYALPTGFERTVVQRTPFVGAARKSHRLRRLERSIQRKTLVKRTLAAKPKPPTPKVRVKKVRPAKPHKWTREERNARLPRTMFGISLQSGGFLKPSKPAIPATRAERDEIQRQAAIKHAEAIRKAVPKLERKKAVLDARDKRNPAYVETQAGKFVGAAVGAAAALALTQLLRVVRGGKKALDSVNAIFDQMRSVGDTLKQYLGPVLWAAPLVLTVYFALRHFRVVTAPAHSLVIAALSSVVGAKLWKIIAKFFPESDSTGRSDIECQAGLMEHAPKILSAILTFSVFKGRRTPASMGEFCKRIAMLDRMSTGWETFLRWMMEALEVGVNFVRKTFGKERISFFQNTHKVTYDWASRVDEAIKQHTTANVDVNTEELNKLVGLVNEGHGFKEIYRGTSMFNIVNGYLVKAAELLHPHLGSINSRNNFRFEPVCSMFLGEPGIGKTLMAIPFCSTVLIESGIIPRGPETNFNTVTENIWQKGTSEFWNSYSKQHCVVLDDAFQQRADSKDKDNEFINIIRMVSSWSMPLNFADLTSKGRIFFGSKFLFGTTNVPCITSEARIVLHEPEAVARRLKYPYRIILKDEFKLPSTGRLNMVRYDQESLKCRKNNTSIDRYPWHIWEAVKHDFITGASVGDPVPLKSVLMEISEDLKQRLASHGDNVDAHSDYIKGLMDSVAVQSGLVELSSSSRRPSFDGTANDDPDYVVVGDLPSLKDFRQGLKANLSEHLEGAKGASKALKFGVLAVGVFVAFEIVKTILRTVWNTLQALFSRKPGKPRIQSNRPLTAHASRMAFKDVRMQGCDASVATNVYANTYKLTINFEDGAEFVMGQVCFVEHDLAVMPEHFSAQMKEKLNDGEIKFESKLKFRHSMNEMHTFEMSVRKFLSFARVTSADRDVEFVRFEDVRAHRNITTNFMKEGDVKWLGGNRARLDVCGVDERKRVCNPTTRSVFVMPSISFGRNLTFTPRKLERYFSYSAHTVSGDCGAPLCIFDNSSYSGRTVIGMHVAGAEARRVGYSSIITQEMIVEARDSLGVIQDAFEADLKDRGISLQAGNSLPFSHTGSFLPIGEVERPVIICPKTSLYVVDDLYGVFGEYNYHPAPLSPVYRDGQLVYPMENAVKPYSSPLLMYEQPWLKTAMHVAMQPLSSVTRDHTRSLYTFEEAVCGIPQEKFRSIPRGTAAGFPYVYDVRNGKKEFFGEGDTYDLTTPKALELRERVDYIITCARKGTRLSHIFVDFLKDELRSEQKVRDVATRLISSAPLDYVVAWRMLFGAFCTAVMKNHTLSGMAPGICTYTDWNMLACHLQKMGESVFDGDFKAFDSSEQPSLHGHILDFINKWYNDGEELARARRVLWLDLVHSRHIGGLGKDQRYIYQWNKSLPSGHPFTTIVNSMYSLTLLVSAYIVLTNDLTGFWRNVSAVTYGDDNASNPSPQVAEQYNQVTVAKALWDQFRVVYTPGTKDGNWQPLMNLQSIGFLKRGFRDDGGFWACPLELDSFLYTCYWCKNKKLESKITIDVLENALEELSMHTDGLWDAYAPKIYQLIQERGHEPKAPLDRDQYLAIIKSRSDSWF